MSSELSTCALCPRLCRPACPVATGTAREAATPTAIATAVLRWERGQWDRALASAAATLCTDCGACEAWCHLGRPLPALLREARAALTEPPPIAPLTPIEGEGATVAVLTDGRDWAAALADRLGEPVCRWPTADALGVGAAEHPAFATHAIALRGAVGDRQVVVAHGGAARALRAAQIPYRWLHEVLPELADGAGSCEAGGERPLSCCGAGGPLRAHHPADADRVAAAFARRLDAPAVCDARCRDHLRGASPAVTDAVDRLLGPA